MKINYIPSKICSNCGFIKPMTAEYFNKKSKKYGSKDGFYSICCKCRNANRRKAYHKNPNHYRKQHNDFYAKNYKTNTKSRIISIKKRLKENSLKSKQSDKNLFNLKKCNRCDVEKQNTKEFFNTRPDSIDGFNRVCKECDSNKVKKFARSKLKFNTNICKKLSIYDEVRQSDSNKTYAQCKCAYCGRWIIPTYGEVKARLASCESINFGENRIYCPGDQCREACPTYKQQYYPKGFKQNSSREVDPLIRQMCMARDDYSCQMCGVSGDGVILHAHHILSYKKNIIIANDIDNVITLCRGCHNNIHTTDGCKYHELRCG